MGKRYSWGFLPSLQLSSTLKGGRLDFLSQIQGDLNGGYLRILPSISFGISKRVSSRLLWYLLLRLSGRLPTFSELYWNNNGWVQGNPSLKGERGLGGDVGLRVRKYGLHELVFFYYVVKDAIFWMPQGEFWRPQNLSFVRFLGIETETTRGLGPFDLRGSMSLLLTSVKGGNVLPYRPNLSGRFEFSYKGMAVILTGAGKRPTHFSPRSEALPPYLLLDLSLSRSLNREHGKRVFELVFELRNLLDTSYEVISGYPMPGRNFTLSISMRP